MKQFYYQIVYSITYLIKKVKTINKPSQDFFIQIKNSLSYGRELAYNLIENIRKIKEYEKSFRLYNIENK